MSLGQSDAFARTGLDVRCSVALAFRPAEAKPLLLEPVGLQGREASQERESGRDDQQPDP